MATESKEKLDYEIRNGTILDAMDLKEINEKCLAENYPFDIYFQHLSNWADICFVATVNKKIAGYVMCFMEVNAETQKTIGHITSIAVLPEYRNHGIASRLMVSVLVAMKTHKFQPDVSHLHVRVSNEPAIHIYQDRLRYKKIKKIDGYYDNPKEDAWMMERQLK